METKKELRNESEAYPMKSGDDLLSYSNNSDFQREIASSANQLVSEAIAESLDIVKFSPSTIIRVADLGCSVGPNTFFAVQNILEAIQHKYYQNQAQVLNSQTPEFQVFFNDHSTNDFNTLFSSLPPDRRYHAAGVPGSFYSRLFPTRSLHIVHVSYAIHWLSGVPKQVVDRTSPAWNRGRIFYPNAGEEVVEAYSTQWAEDMAAFLQARAQEIASGGLMILIFPTRPDGIPHSQVSTNVSLNVLEACLIDMAKKGMVSQEKVDLFNVPMYHMSPQELGGAVERNGCFSIEKMGILPHPTTSHYESLTSPRHKAQVIASHIRAAVEGLIKAHFGDNILDQLFNSYSRKLEDEFPALESSKTLHYCAVLKRKTLI